MRAPRSRYRSLPLLVVLLVCMAGTVVAWRASSRAADADHQLNFQSRVARVALLMQGTLDHTHALVHGIEGLVAASPDVSEERWGAFARSLLHDESHAELESLTFIADHGAGTPGWTEHRRDAPPVGVSPELSGPIHAAAESGRPQVSFVKAAAFGPGQKLVLVEPLRDPLANADPARSTTALVAVVLDAAAAIERQLESVRTSLAVEIFDARPTPASVPVYSTHAWAARGSPMEESLAIRLAGRRFWIRVSATRQFIQERPSTAPITVLQAGLGVSGVVLTIVLAMHRSRESAVVIGRALQEREREAQRAHAATTAAAAAKDGFIARVSHELRTPMAAILGHAEMLLDPQLSGDEREESIRTIRRNGDRLLGLINDVLDFSKLEAGRMRVEPVPCSPVAVTQDAIALLRPSARAKGLELVSRYDFPLPAHVRLDPSRLHQILINILGNAIKFTDHGGVRVRLRMEPAESGARLRIDVQDDGIGIAPEQIARLFEPFSQADASATRRFGGTGLGLTISRDLARLMGGDLAATSEPGRGSTFTITLPCEATGGATVHSIEAATGNAADDNATAPSLRGEALLVDDSPDILRLIGHWLRRAGMTIHTVPNGRKCVDLVRASKPGRFALVVLDMQMPEMDGYTTARSLRDLAFAAPIIALTANAVPGDRERCLSAGCDEYLHKPVSRAGLIHACARLLERAHARAA
jgi:signal transduction histidine kinase/ActR/RegA family two-component response regulator